ncbi:MAG: NADH:quinone oxidoreductase [Alphaproteobacteria bacterium]|jgi:NADH-quinone oxidoreductase subunit E|nr:NADH:quinone oxidoreductase [Alphaproteobacteria bacterium]
MAHSEFKNAPPLFGWAIAVAAGVLMFGVSMVALGIGAIGSVAIGVVVALIVGVIFTLAEGAPKPAPTEAATPDTATSAASVAPAPSAPATPAADAVPAKSDAPSSSDAAAGTTGMTAAGGTTTASAAASKTDMPAAETSAADAESAGTAQADASGTPGADAAAPEPVQPKGLDAPVGDKDDLKRISGVGPVLEGKLNGLGFYHFWQIAEWSRAEVDWVDSYLSFKGRIDRDDWIAQATKLAEESPAKPPA